MKKDLLLAITAICSIVMITACTTEDNPPVWEGKTTSLFVASDRHEAGNGNNLAAAIQKVANRNGIVTPSVVLLGGDYVGSGPDAGDTGQPAFTLADLRSEIFLSLNPNKTEIFFTYGSHDRNCTDDYSAFFSGPHRCDGYYIYGISYAQMAYATDSLTRAAVALYDEQGDNIPGNNPPPANNDSTMPMPQQPSGGLRAYNGIDIADPYGISAESASARFAAWADTLSGHDPIIVMSHVPIHASRNDNPGGLRWFNTLSRAAQKHDIVLLFGHNHTLEERGNSSDSGMYLLAPGDSITVQGDSVQGAQRQQLPFTYANAGYLKLGWCTLITFNDTDADGHPDYLQLRRFSAIGDKATRFGSTDKPNPWLITLKAK
jgi:hypothetical protein